MSAERRDEQGGDSQQRERARWAYAEWLRECERQRAREAQVRLEQARRMEEVQ